MVVGMMSRPVDKAKKSNIKCEHCEAFDNDKELGGWCCIHEKPKNYWNRCKNFIWHHKYNNQI